ncbi:MAG TPA: hypothetical protein PKD51_01790, partial [Saprospiraceae bacterium]|nr:hypothetical protein [Saprospiraceae bacterium]
MRIILTFLIIFSFRQDILSQFSQDSTYSYQELNRILETARENKDQKTLAQVYLKLADYEGDIFGDYRRALEYYKWALEYFKVTGDSSRVYETNFYLAQRYLQAGFVDESLTILLNLADVHSKSNNQIVLANIYFEINKVYKRRGDYEMSLDYLEKAVAINQIVKDTTLLTNILFEKIASFENNFDL